jgi:hypothetical protein
LKLLSPVALGFNGWWALLEGKGERGLCSSNFLRWKTPWKCWKGRGGVEKVEDICVEYGSWVWIFLLVAGLYKRKRTNFRLSFLWIFGSGFDLIDLSNRKFRVHEVSWPHTKRFIF